MQTESLQLATERVDLQQAKFCSVEIARGACRSEEKFLSEWKIAHHCGVSPKKEP